MSLQELAGAKKRPPLLISASLIVCERVLIETDGVTSAIRLVEIFYVQQTPEEARDRQAVMMTVFVLVKAEPTEDETEYDSELILVRPNGESKVLEIEPTKFSLRTNPKFPGTPGGFAMALKLPVLASQMGIHRLSLRLDGKEIARTAFTLAPQQDSANQ